jgi:hypothetical protein
MDLWFLDVRSRSAVIFSMHNNSQKMEFLIRFHEVDGRYKVYEVLPCTPTYVVKGQYSNQYDNHTKIQVVDGNDKSNEFELGIYENEIGRIPKLQIYRNASSRYSICSDIGYAYFINYPISEENMVQTKSDTIDDLVCRISKYKEIVEFIRGNDDINDDFVKVLEDKCTSRMQLYSKLMHIKKRIKDENSKVADLNRSIDSELNELKVICKICFTSECKSILYCGHFICNDCIGKIKKDNILTCPYCKENVSYHSFYLN